MNSEYFASFLVPVFNQEVFVEEALASILNQDCPPSEVLIADDCSTDQTFQIVKKVVTEYRGPHFVVASQNRKNLGGGNIMEIGRRASARFLIEFHGDDSARPERAARLVAALRDTGASLVSSNARLVDTEGRPFGTMLKDEPSRFLELSMIVSGWKRTQTGSTQAYERNVIDQFLPWAPDSYWAAGDHVRPFRAALLGGSYYLDEILLDRRQHPGNMGKEVVPLLENQRSDQEFRSARFLMARSFMLRDLNHYVKKNGETHKTIEARDLLSIEISRNVETWAKSRSSLMNNGLRPAWIPREQFLSEIDTTTTRVLADQGRLRLFQRTRQLSISFARGILRRLLILVRGGRR